MILAGDVGGTKTSLALYDPRSNSQDPVYKTTLSSADYPSLEALVRGFLGEANRQAETAAFAVAGPVVQGQAEITNLPWVIHEDALKDALDMKSVRLLNDLTAVALAVPLLQPDDVHVIQAGRPASGGTIGVLAPGTGLGEAFLTWNGERYLAFPSEGGHVDFAPTSPLELGLLRYLQERFGHVSYERVASGMGLPNIYNYLKEMGFATEPAWLAAELRAAADPTPVILRAALDRERSCDLCRTALETFVSVLGAEAGNLALKLLATGGVYIGGGIPPRILPALTSGAFLQAFLNKGRFADLLEDIPLNVILDTEAGLKGAAHFAGAI